MLCHVYTSSPMSPLRKPFWDPCDTYHIIVKINVTIARRIVYITGAFLPSACHGTQQTLMAEQRPLLVGLFTMCLVLGTRQIKIFVVCRFLPCVFTWGIRQIRPLPCVVCLPCVSWTTLGKLWFCRAPKKLRRQTQGHTAIRHFR